MHMERRPFDPRCSPPEHVFLPVGIDQTGTRGPTRGQSSGPHWRRVGRNSYVPTTADTTLPEQRILEATGRLPVGGAVTGWAALRLAGAAYFEGRRRDGSLRPVPLALGRPTGRRRYPEVTNSYETLPPADVSERCGIPVTVPAAALFYELRSPPFEREAVVAADMAFAAGVTTLATMQALTVERSRWDRSPWAASALRFASERSRSPNESRLRLVWRIDAGLPEPLVNQPVFDHDGQLVCIADLLDPEAGLVVEYDGAEHREARRHTQDVARTERIRQAGLELTTITAHDLPRRALVVHRLRQARDRSLFLPESRRGWTLVEPPGWRAPWPPYPRSA